jgi:hypothetical protein
MDPTDPIMIFKTQRMGEDRTCTYEKKMNNFSTLK